MTTSQTVPKPGPLSGIRVLDLSRVLAGPWAGQLLAELGADVIKVERPGSGDDTRNWGPPYMEDADGRPTGEATYYLSCNRGKKSIAVDIHHPKGAALITRLAGDVDILLENFKKGGLAKYGLDYASLSAVNPRLIYCSITGFGQTGPYADRAGYDFIIQAMSGLMSVTGERDDKPGGGPQKLGIAISDLCTGLYGVIGILAALHQRQASGRGQHIDMALMDVMTSLMSNQAMAALAGGLVPGRQGNAHVSIVPYQMFETADSHLVLAVGNDRQFAAFVAVAGDARLRSPDFAHNPDRVRRRDSLIPIIEEVMALRTTADWCRDLDAVGVPAGPIYTMDQVFRDPHVDARGLVETLDHPLRAGLPTLRAPLLMSDAAVGTDRAAPLLNADRDDILTRLGLSHDDIAGLVKDGVLMPDTDI